MSVSTLPQSVQNPDPLSSALSVGAPYANTSQGVLAQRDAAFKQHQQQMAAAEAESKPILDKAEQGVQQADTALQGELAKPLQKDPLPTNPAQHLDPKQMQETASMFMALGAIAGLVTRQPLTASLNNMTAAMKGVQEKDQEQFDESYKQFQDNYKRAMDKNKEYLEERRQIIDDRKTSLTEKMEMLKLASLRAGDKTGALAKTYAQQSELLDAHAKATQHAEDKAQQLQFHVDQMVNERKRIALESQRVEIERQKLRDSENQANGTSGLNRAQLIDAIAEGRVNINNISLRKNEREQMLKDVLAKHPDYDQYKGASRAATLRAFSVGKEAQAVRSFNVVDSHLQTFQKAFDALDNGNIPLANKLMNGWAKETGQPAPAGADAIKRVVADEIVKAVTGAAGALGDRESADKSLSTADSPKAMKTVVSDYRELIAGQMDGLEHQYERGTGNKDFKQKFIDHPPPGEASQHTDPNTPPPGFKPL